MTKGFKVLLHDLQQLMSDIKESGGVHKKASTMSVEKGTSTIEINGHTAFTNEGQHPPTDDVHREEMAAPSEKLPPRSKSSEMVEVDTSLPKYQSLQRKKNLPGGQRKPGIVKPPLLSSAPKRFSSDANTGDTEASGFGYNSVSDISDVESDRSEGQRFSKDKRVIVGSSKRYVNNACTQFSLSGKQLL